MSLVQQLNPHRPWSATMKRETQTYFTPREASQDYSDYWGTVTDPDGKRRQRLSKSDRDNFIELTEGMWSFVVTAIEKSKTQLAFLEVGCGPGWFRGGLDGRWYGTELNDDAETVAKSFGYRMLKPKLSDITGSFDVIIMHHVIEHMPDPITEICHVHRILKRGGHLLLATPDFASPCAKRFGDRYRLLHDKTHCSLFTNESMHRFLRDFGFRILDVQYPFPDRYATAENMQRWLDGTGVSPPWPGNFMTFYCRK